MKRALIIRHAAPETLAQNFRTTLESHGFRLEPLNIFEAAPAYDKFSPPDISGVSLILVLGGPLSANDDYPALHAERAYLQSAMAMQKPVFGICLGAQLMATALGGTVQPTGGFQFGLRKISVTADGHSDPVFNKLTVPLVPTLHGECFTIPSGAVKLAEGFMLCHDGHYRRINMAFRYGNSYAFQFEPQLTLEELRVWDLELRGDYELMGDQFDATEEAARNLREFAGFAPVHEAQMREMLIAFLNNAGLI
jgi:GMP synthase (glutamine-hydrolysing)